jgi:hypothetical protein
VTLCVVGCWSEGWRVYIGIGWAGRKSVERDGRVGRSELRARGWGGGELAGEMEKIQVVSGPLFISTSHLLLGSALIK